MAGYDHYPRVSNSQQLGSPSAMSGYAMLVSGAAVAAPGANTRYLNAPGGNGLATEGPLFVATRACTIQNLYAVSATAPGGSDTVIFTVDTSTDNGANWSATTLTCTITGANKSNSDTTHQVAVAAGSLVSVKIVSSAGTAAGIMASFEVA